MIQSMSKREYCPENAVAESFVGNWKNAMIYHRNFVGRGEARAAIFDYIEVFYNRQRVHQSLGYNTPVNIKIMEVA